MPLVFQPGSEWNYGVSTDVLGRLVEVISGQPLDEFFEQRIFAPLGMTDTSFGLRPGRRRRRRWPGCTSPTPGQPGGPSSGMMFSEAFDAAAHSKPAFLSGGGGLVSTAGDYLRFVETAAPRRVLRRRPAARLAHDRPHGRATTCPATQDLETFGRPLFAETPLRGVGLRARLLDGHRPGALRRRRPASATTAGAARRPRRSTSTRSRT